MIPTPRCASSRRSSASTCPAERPSRAYHVRMANERGRLPKARREELNEHLQRMLDRWFQNAYADDNLFLTMARRPGLLDDTRGPTRSSDGGRLVGAPCSAVARRRVGGRAGWPGARGGWGGRGGAPRLRGGAGRGGGLEGGPAPGRGRPEGGGVGGAISGPPIYMVRVTFA